MTAEVASSFLLLADRGVSPLYLEDLARTGRYRPVGRTDSISTAVEAVRARGPELVVADVATVDRLQQVTAALPRMAGSKVVVVTALPPEVALLTTMAAGARAFLQKPLEGDVFGRAVASVLSGHVVVDPRATSWLVGLALHGHRARPANGLTLRQSQVVVLVRGGLTNREIARVLGLSIDTVKTHLREAMKRLGARDRWAATVLAERLDDEDGKR